VSEKRVLVARLGWQASRGCRTNRWNSSYAYGWEEGDGARFWRGSVQEIESGLVSHFQDGGALLRFLNARLVARNGIALARGQAGGQSQ